MKSKATREYEIRGTLHGVLRETIMAESEADAIDIIDDMLSFAAATLNGELNAEITNIKDCGVVETD